MGHKAHPLTGRGNRDVSPGPQDSPAYLSRNRPPSAAARRCLRLPGLPPGPQPHGPVPPAPAPRPLPSPPLPSLLGAAPSSSSSSEPKYATPGAVAAAPRPGPHYGAGPYRGVHHIISFQRIRREARPGRQQKVKTQLTPIRALSQAPREVMKYGSGEICNALLSGLSYNGVHANYACRLPPAPGARTPQRRPGPGPGRPRGGGGGGRDGGRGEQRPGGGEKRATRAGEAQRPVPCAIPGQRRGAEHRWGP